MSATNNRLELTIDVVALPAQHALALASLTPAELVAAALAEFRELPYLGDRVSDYQLLRAGGEPLDEERPLAAQLSGGERLALAERPVVVPQGATRPRQALYLRERGGQVFHLSWAPAIIGRHDPSLAGNELIAVDVSAYPAGQRVSRRHAQIVERSGQFFVERLSPNPTAVIGSDCQTTTVADTAVPICHGDTLLLERSQLTLTFLVRGEASQ